MRDDTFRTLIALGCVLGAVWLHFSGTIMFTVGVVLWLLLAAGAGYMLPYGWMILVAPVPWLIGVAGGVLVGQHEEFGDVWALPMVMSTLAGLFGVIFGAAARRNRNRRNTGGPD